MARESRAALIGGQGLLRARIDGQGGVASVDGGAAGQERDGLSWSAVICEWAHVRIDERIGAGGADLITLSPVGDAREVVAVADQIVSALGIDGGADVAGRDTRTHAFEVARDKRVVEEDVADSRDRVERTRQSLSMSS